MKNLRTSAFVITLLLTLVFSSSYAQNRPLYEIHSMMIYNFIKYIQWPSSNQSQEFIIAVIGDDEVYNTLNTWYGGKLRGNKKFVVKNFSSPDQIQDCHILYVAKGSSKNFDEIKAKLNHTSTLIITDKPGLGEKGSGINFRTINSKLAFELNQKVIQDSQLKVSGQLSSMAILI